MNFANDNFKLLKALRRLAMVLPPLFAAILLFACAKDTTGPGNSNYAAGLIAFSAYGDSFQTDLEIYVVDAYAYTPQVDNISNLITTDCRPEWISGKSALIFISSTDHNSALYRFNPSTYERYLFFSTETRIAKIAASPVDARLIYFANIPNDSRLALNILNTETLDTTRLAEIGLDDDPPVAWSTDGTKLAIGAGAVLVFDMEDGGLLYSLGSRADYLAWDVAGERLYILRSGDLFRADSLQEYSVLIGRNLALPAISPDKRYLACVSYASGSSLIIIDLNFGDYITVRSVHPPQFSCGDYRMLSWSSDSREVAFIDQENGAWNIYRVDRDGYSAIERVTDDVTFKESLAW